jgi:hypothetical protein
MQKWKTTFQMGFHHLMETILNTGKIEWTTYLKALGEDVWFSVASRYNSLKKLKTATEKEAKRNNKMAIDTILDGLTDLVKSKVGSCASAKEIWYKLQDLYAMEEVEEEEEVEEDYNISNFKEENRGQFFCFNCEGVGHVEFECPHPRIERDCWIMLSLMPMV